jgi:hypothetical protein
METLKKYWWLFLLIPIGFYVLYVYYRAKNEVNDSLKKARAAKEDKRILKISETETDNGGDHKDVAVV